MVIEKVVWDIHIICSPRNYSCLASQHYVKKGFSTTTLYFKTSTPVTRKAPEHCLEVPLGSGQWGASLAACMIGFLSVSNDK